mmetsp:Transcript_34765/g.84002  ORF Transcript_34765/g.84002 Transcript_34765/m.84002 type:complete len:82 (-) Transcript_34765:43-288(-)
MVGCKQDLKDSRDGIEWHIYSYKCRRQRLFGLHLLCSSMNDALTKTYLKHSIIEPSMDVHILAPDSNGLWDLTKTFSAVNP